MTVSVHPLENPDHLLSLARDADQHGHPMVSRLHEDWLSGTNRFDRPGEVVLAAVDAQLVVAVCGLNRDPYASDQSTGRVRRLYVASDRRYEGIGRMMIESIQDHCTGFFKQLNLRTYDPDAGTFYCTVGFTRVLDNTYCTHQRAVTDEDL